MTQCDKSSFDSSKAAKETVQKGIRGFSLWHQSLLLEPWAFQDCAFTLKAIKYASFQEDCYVKTQTVYVNSGSNIVWLSHEVVIIWKIEKKIGRLGHKSVFMNGLRGLNREALQSSPQLKVTTL